MYSPFRSLILLLLAVACFAGCRTDPSVKLLQSELRWMEDQIYALEEQYQLKCQELESCRLAHQAMAEPAERNSENRQRQPSSRRQPQEDTGSPPIEPPRVEGLPGLGTPRPLQLPAADGTGVRPSSFHMLTDQVVTHVLLNQQLTGGYDRDGLPGDDGVMVVIEPRNSSGQFIPLPGETTIVLRDAEAPTDKTIAKWKLTPQQAHAKMKTSLLGRGVHLELAWPGKPPKAGDYELAVTYLTDGKKLTAQREVRIDPPRDPSLRWTPVSDVVVEPGFIDDAVEEYHIDEGMHPQALPPPASYGHHHELPSSPVPQKSSVNAPPAWSPGR